MDTTQPKKILVLENDPKRLAAYEQHFKAATHVAGRPYEVHYAKTYREFVQKMFQHSPFDFVTLDHDLNDYNPNYTMDGNPLNPPEFTGAHAAQYIAAMPLPQRPRSIMVHSHNPSGAFNMQTILQHAFISVGVRPFHPRDLPIP